nr:MAG TPA: hypothetical protein [Caudoviricetes sp.]
MNFVSTFVACHRCRDKIKQKYKILSVMFLLIFVLHHL